MALTQLTDNLNIHQSLADKPNQTDGLTAPQLKAKWDEAVGLIKTYINDTLIAELEATTDGSSGSSKIGYPDVTYPNVEAIIKAILSAGSGSIPPDGTVTDDKLSNTAGQIKAVVATNTTDIDNQLFFNVMGVAYYG